MANIGQELSSISFGSIIGGALNALIEAQSQAAYTTIDFINSVGFSAADASGQKKPTYVAFRYTKEISPYLLATDTEPERQAVTRDMLLQVPLLTMLLVPFIRIADAIIDFNAKINSVTTTSNQETNSYGGSLDVDTSFSFWRLKTSAKRNATLPNQKTSGYEEAIKRDYSLGIHIRAIQDQVPAGTERLLDILQDAIVSVDAGATKEDTKKQSASTPAKS